MKVKQDPKTGSVKKCKIMERTSVLQENVKQIAASFERNCPKTCINNAIRDLLIPKWTVHKISRNWLDCYHEAITFRITNINCFQGTAFKSQWQNAPRRVSSYMLAHHEDDPTFLQRISIHFSDETTFHVRVCARVNKDNCRICMR